MGYQYVNTIAAILQQHNPNLSDEEAHSLSRVGLHDTSFWNFTLSNTEKVNAIHFNEVGRGTKSDSSSKQIRC